MRCLVPGNNTYRQVQMFKEADKQRNGETWNVCLHVQLLTLVQLFATLWTIVCRAPLSMEFSRQEYWSGLPFPCLPNPVTEPTSPRAPALCRWFFFLTTEPPGKPQHIWRRPSKGLPSPFLHCLHLHAQIHSHQSLILTIILGFLLLKQIKVLFRRILVTWTTIYQLKFVHIWLEDVTSNQLLTG